MIYFKYILSVRYNLNVRAWSKKCFSTHAYKSTRFRYKPYVKVQLFN